MRINNNIISRLRKSAEKSKSNYRISAIALDHKGNILGSTSNKKCGYIPLEHYTRLCETKCSRSGLGIHAERLLMSRYGNLIKTIIIYRIGKSGDPLPIQPCSVCSKVANKLGIKIISVT